MFMSLALKGRQSFGLNRLLRWLPIMDCLSSNLDKYKHSLRKISMKSGKRGKSISPVEIAITRFGLWLWVKEEEFFLAFEEYPFFRKALVCEIYNVDLLHDAHLHWPDLDADLSLDILRHPDAFPLIDRSSPFSHKEKVCTTAERGKKSVVIHPTSLCSAADSSESS